MSQKIQDKTSIAKRLSAYSTLAAATAVTGGNANAAAVIHDITDLTIVASAGNTVFNMQTGGVNPGQPTNLTIPVGNFGVRAGNNNAGFIEAAYASVSPGVGFMVGANSRAFSSSYPGVDALGAGVVSAAQNFVAYTYSSAFAALGTAGNTTWGFAEGQTAYVGLKFDLVSGTHYGWAQLTRDAGSDDYILHGFGYNDEVGASSLTSDTVDSVPESSSLALLALGAAGLIRRKRQLAA